MASLMVCGRDRRSVRLRGNVKNGDEEEEGILGLLHLQKCRIFSVTAHRTQFYAH